ncbi:retrovirus-related pol polyprotein from transposon TNT 1-94, partial [Tanacetum coccineum]
HTGCSKHMTGNHSWLINFVKKFIGAVRFGNDHFGVIMGYRDYVISDIMISRVYYMEGLGHNLFFVGQIYDLDLEVAFRKHSCYVRTEDGVDLLKGSRGSNMYTISVEDMMKSSPIILLSKASKNKSWLWHRRLNHLNLGTINDLARKDLVRGLPRLKFKKDHLCSACQLGKSKKYTHKPKSKNTIMEVLHTLHMDLCGPIQVQSINGKKYILNGVVERQNQNLVETARTKLIFLKVLMFLWAEAVATACYIENRSLIHTRHNKTPYEIPILLMSGQISSRLVPDPVLAAPYVPLTNTDLEILFQPMFDKYLEPPNIERSVPLAPAAQVLVVSTDTPPSTTIAQDAPSISYSLSSSVVQPPISHQGVAAGPTIEDNPFAQADNDTFVNVFAPEPSSDESLSGDASSAESTQATQPHNHLRKWSNDHPLDNVIDNPSRPVCTRKQLATDALWCRYNSILSKVEPENVKTVMDEACWFEAMQE